jgi:acetolactate synthase-1/2/3 large subunit
MPTHAEVMAAVLAERGVEYIFGLPGGEIVAFIDACRRAGLRFLLTGHEASAAWMAQVVGQITGVPGVCATTLGPGATNLATGIANAWLDRAPMLAVTAEIPEASYATLTHQRVPLRALFGPITKRTATIGSRDTADLVNESLDLAARPRPGPLHLALPSDLAVKQCAGSGPVRQAPLGLAQEEAPLDRIVACLESAARPLVLIGLGATPAAAPAIRALLAKLQAPFLVSPKAKGIVPEDDPLFLGVATGMAIDKDILETIRSADLVLAIGFDPVECDKTWFADIDIVAIDSCSMAEGRYQPDQAIGDIESLVTRLAAAITLTKPWPGDLLERRRQAILRTPSATKQGLSPLRVIEELRSVLPRDGIATCDVGSHKLLMGQFWRAYEPGTFFMSNGLSGMGFGIPAAIAAQLVSPDKPVLAVVGDGGMLMMLHDLALIRELKLPVIVVVLSDGSLSLIRLSAERRGFSPYGVDFQPPDFRAIAEAFGIAGKRVSDIAELRDSVDQALSDRCATVIDVLIDYREYGLLV